jgi:gamma-glutamyltranspeptidase / glutathione hydrolase
MILHFVSQAFSSGRRTLYTAMSLMVMTGAMVACIGSSSTDTACTFTGSQGWVVVGSGLPGDPSLPEPSSGYKLGHLGSKAQGYMVSTANPLATQAGCVVLRDGGTAVDAAIAIQMVLGLVEPQSSGLGGGAFMLHFDAASGRVDNYDGRETAPAAATENDLRYANPLTLSPIAPDLGSPTFGNTRASGRSIGTPGVLKMLELAHREHGKKPWADLFQPAIQLATQGFAINGRLADAIVANAQNLQRDAEASAYFLHADGTHKTLGTVLKNPAYAQTLTAIAQSGAVAFYEGPIAQDIVAKIKASVGADGTPMTPGKTELSDLSNYQAIRREAVCSTYRNYWVCGAAPPSSGGIAVAQILGILENFNMANYPPAMVDANGGKPSVDAAHLMAEAQRLAYADRNKYVADTDFVRLPGYGVSSMLDKGYLNERSRLINLNQSMGTARAGTWAYPVMAGSSANEGKGTSHISVVDRYGNALSMTTTIESSMGSFHFTRGFLLNNQLTDFSFEPSDADGPIANRIQALKRPRSSMAPTLVFHKASDGSRGDFLMATGSPGGGNIIQYVSKTLVAVLDWGLDAQQATSFVNFGAANSPTTGVGGEHPLINTSNNGANDALVTGLRARGHTVSITAQSSGVATILRTSGSGGAGASYQGAADPRREGIALGGP